MVVDHGGGADHGGADEHGLGGGFEGVAGAVVGFEKGLGALEVYVDVVVPFQLALNAGNLLDQRKFIDGLRVVSDGAVGIDSNCDRSHPEKTESHEPEGEHRSRDHDAAEPQIADDVADGHQHDHRQSNVVCREVARYEAGEDAEGCATFLGRADDFFYVPRFGGGEDFDQLGDDGAG